jgi:uncharacterized protein (DUF433 family)
MKAVSRTDHPHIERRLRVCGGEPVLRGTRFPVRSVVVYVYRHGMTPEEVAGEWKHLSLAGIYDALSYYHDHKEQIDRLIRDNRESLARKKAIG